MCSWAVCFGRSALPHHTRVSAVLHMGKDAVLVSGARFLSLSQCKAYYWGFFVITLPFAIPVPPSLQSAYFSLALRTSLRTLSCTCHDVDVEAEAANNLAFVCARGTRTTK